LLEISAAIWDLVRAFWHNSISSTQLLKVTVDRVAKLNSNRWPRENALFVEECAYLIGELPMGKNTHNADQCLPGLEVANSEANVVGPHMTGSS
jgi:hypothetical protein